MAKKKKQAKKKQVKRAVARKAPEKKGRPETTQLGSLLIWDGSSQFTLGAPLAGKFIDGEPSIAGEVLVYNDVSDQWEPTTDVNAGSIKGQPIANLPLNSALLYYDPASLQWEFLDVGDALDQTGNLLSVQYDGSLSINGSNELMVNPAPTVSSLSMSPLQSNPCDRGEVQLALDDLENKINAILTSLKSRGLMAS